MKKSKESWQGQNKKGIRELRSALDSATSSVEKLKIFKKIEARLDEHQLGADCWVMSVQYHKEGQEPLKVLSFGKRSLDIMLRDETNHVLGTKRSSLAIGSVLHLLGSACFQLNRFNESLSYLNWSDRNLSELLLDNYDDESFVLESLRNTHLQLSKVKKAMGRGDEVVFHFKKVLEVDEKTMDKGCIEIGSANHDVANACKEIGNFKEALPFALKALEICQNHLASDSKEVTMLRSSLGDVYSELGEYDKAFEQNRLSLSGLKCMGITLRLLTAELKGGQLLVCLGRYEEAIKALKRVISQVEAAVDQRGATETAKIHGVRAVAFMVIAKAFYRQEKLADARKYITMGVRMLEKQRKRIDPGIIASGFTGMAKLYVEMKEYEAAISLLQKALNIPELPQAYFAYCSIRVFSLVSLTGTEKQRLSYLEEVVEKLKEKFGLEHCHVGYGYEKLGLVYLELGRPEMAADLLVRAKDIFDVSLGPYHLESLKVSQCLSIAYVEMGSNDLAIENQEKIVEGFKGLGLSEQENMDTAVQILNKMKGGSIGEVDLSHRGAFHLSENGEDLCAVDSNVVFQTMER